MSVFSNSKSSMDLADWDWCLDHAQDFIQGILLPGGILISPIEITAAPIGDKEMQQRFYEQVPDFRLRRGPVADDKTRMTEPIAYKRGTYPYPVSLVSPPILLQTRVEKTAVCTNELGSSYQDKVWKDASGGVTCEFPYACDEELLNTSTVLMACSSENLPPEFFGRPPQNLLGQQQ
jgi:hypothetical protein